LAQGSSLTSENLPFSAGVNGTESMANLAKSALLVVDMQNDFCHPAGWCAKAGIPDASTPIIPAINQLVDAARAQKIPVVWICANYSPDLLNQPFAAKTKDFGGSFPCETEWGMGIIEQFKVEDSDTKVQKSCYNGFYGTDLAATLRAKGVDTVVATGVLTSVCVESTVRGAFFDGFHVVVAQDAVGDAPDATASSLTCLGTFFGSVQPADEICSKWAAEGK